MATNLERAHWAETATTAFIAETGNDEIADTIKDLVSDLGHLAEAKGIKPMHFVSLIESALGQWSAEREAGDGEPDHNHSACVYLLDGEFGDTFETMEFAATTLLRQFTDRYRAQIMGDVEIDGGDAVADLCEMWADAEMILNGRKPASRQLFITLEGGIIGSVLSSDPDFIGCRAVILDYDIEGSDPDDVTMIDVPQGELGDSEAIVRIDVVEASEPEWDVTVSQRIAAAD